MGWARVIGFTALLLLGAARAEVAVPALSARVTDLTATLSEPQIQALEARLADFQTRKGAQLAVLMLPTTQPETIEQFSLRVVEQWKLGRKGADDGVLLLIAKADRTVRIEVGYGLEGALNDATAKRIVADVLTPLLRRGEFYAGVDAALSAVMRVVEQEAPPATSIAAAASRLRAPSPWLLALGVLLAAVVLGVWHKRSPASLSLVIGLLRALLVALFTLLLQMSSRGGGGGRGGGFGSGGFSGGGGSFGGGGASGRW